MTAEQIEQCIQCSLKHQRQVRIETYSTPHYECQGLALRVMVPMPTSRIQVTIITEQDRTQFNPPDNTLATLGICMTVLWPKWKFGD